MADRDDRDRAGRDVALRDVLRGLGRELRDAQGDGVRLEDATVEVDVAVEAGPDGELAFRLAGPRGTKRGRTARLTVRVATDAPAPAAGQAVAEVHEARVHDDAPTTEGARAPGLLDLVADALRTVADTATRPPANRPQADHLWADRPGDAGPG